eukprot:m.863606 g.863606  ORF g.863606 m.863606 type:complete len:310 (+) comp23545_c0_seq3:470-1399(+)
MSAEPIPRAFRKCPTYTKLVDTYTSLCTNKYGICRIAPSEKNAKIVCFQSCHEHTECELLRLSAISQIVASYRQHGAQCSNNHSWILAIFAEAIPDLIDTIVTCSSTVAADAAARAFRTLPWTSDATSKISLCLQDKPERETPQIARAMLSVVHPMISRGLFSCYVDHADSRDHSSDTSAAKPSSICCHTCTETVLLGSHSRGTVGVDGHRRGPTSESKAADVVTWVRLAYSSDPRRKIFFEPQRLAQLHRFLLQLSRFLPPAQSQFNACQVAASHLIIAHTQDFSLGSHAIRSGGSGFCKRSTRGCSY